MRYGLLSEILLTGAAFAVMTSTVQAQPEMLTLNKNTSHYMNMNQPITRIAIGGNKDFATVVQLPGSTSEFLIVTKKDPGTTTLFVWTADGVRHEYIITVSEEDPGQALLIEQAIGLPDVHVRMVGNRVLLTGTVEDQYEKNHALQTVRLFVGKASDSSLLVGSGFDMKLKTNSSRNAIDGRSGNVEASKSENTGEIIDLLQIRHPTQIRLEAQIIEINSDDAKDLGITYGTNVDESGVFYFGENYNRADDPIHFKNNPVRWIGQHFSAINAKINVLIESEKARILSRPSVVTLSGEQATIQIGGEIPYVTSGTLGYTTNTEFKPYGIILQFKPVVDEYNRINSVIHAEVSNLSGMTVSDMPIISTRSADSVINVYSGGTIVIGGLMDSSEIKNVQKIPLLGDIPILGEFFKHTSKSRDKRELIILVTPRIVGEDDAGQTYWSPTMREWYGLDQKYREAMERVDFNRPKAEDNPTPKVDEPFTNGR